MNDFQDIFGYDTPNPFLNRLGVRLVERRDGFVRVELALQPDHLNLAGSLHGGVLATLLDHAAGFSGTFCPVTGRIRYARTLSMTTQFVKAVRSGTITAIGRKTGGGHRIYFAQSEITSDAGDLVSFGTGTFQYEKGSETAEGIALAV